MRDREKAIERALRKCYPFILRDVPVASIAQCAADAIEALPVQVTDEWAAEVVGDIIEAYGANEDPIPILRRALEGARSA